MSRGFPSMTALLGLLALAGYQNRDKIAEMLRGVGANPPAAPGATAPQQGGLGGVLSQLGNTLGGAGAGGFLSGGLGELMDRFKQNGQGEAADSWVGTGPNKALAAPDLEQAIGPDVLATLSKQTGLSHAGTVGAALARTSRRGRQVHAARPASDRSRFRALAQQHRLNGDQREHPLDHHHRLCRRRDREVHHAGNQ